MSELAGDEQARFSFGQLIIGLIVATAIFAVSSAKAQTARAILGPAAVEPLTGPQPPARIVVDPPLAAPLSHGRVVIQYRTENLHLVPVFGPAAFAVSSRIGLIHVNVDDASWVWVDASGEPVILNGLPLGQHKVAVQLVKIDWGTVNVTMPDTKLKRTAHE